jgi:hypothetical protein
MIIEHIKIDLEEMSCEVLNPIQTLVTVLAFVKRLNEFPVMLVQGVNIQTT